MSESAYRRIIRHLESEVAAGRLRPGDRLPGERRLMQTYEVSRSTVREALRVLDATGVIETRHGDPRGAVVRPFAAESLERPLRRFTEQPGIERVELLQFRLVLEGQVALLAAARGDQQDLSRIARAAEGLGELARLDDGESQDGPHGSGPAAAIDLAAEFGHRLRAFHAAVRRASGNHLLRISGEAADGALTDIARRRLSDEPDDLARQQRLARSAADAATLAAVIAAGDPAAARRTATQNIYRYYRDRLTPQERAALEPLVG